MPKPDCTKLQLAIAKLALNVATRPEVNTLDDVHAALKDELPGITRDDLADAIVAATSGRARAQTDLGRRLAAMKAEARKDTDLREKIDAAQTALAAGTARPPAEKPPQKAWPAAIKKMQAELEGLKGKLAHAETMQEVRDRIKEVEAHIAAGTVPPPKSKPTAPRDLQALRDQLVEKQRTMKDADPAKRDALKKEIADLEAHVAKGTSPPPTPAKPARATPKDLADLREERDRLKSSLSKESPAALQPLRDRLKELTQHLKDGTLPPPAEPKAKAPPKVAALHDAIAEVRKALDRSEPALKKRYESQIAALQERLKDPDLAAATADTGPAPAESKALDRLAFERDNLQRKIRQKIEGLRPKGFWGNVDEGFNLLQGIQTMHPYTGLLKQAGPAVYAHPATTLRAFYRAAKEANTEYGARRLENARMERVNAPEYAKAGLKFRSLDGELNHGEGQFVSRIMARIPGVNWAHRVFVSILNEIRADLYDQHKAAFGGGEFTKEEAQWAAKVIGGLTGSGDLGPVEKHANAISKVIWAPRMIAGHLRAVSGWDALAPSALGGAPTWRTRKLAAKTYAQMIAGISTVYAIHALAGGQAVDWDPRSPLFGKIKVGNTYLDPLFGVASTISFLTREALGETKTTDGKVIPIRDAYRPLDMLRDRPLGKVPYGGRSGFDVATSYVRSHFVPRWGAAADIVSGKDAGGNPVSPVSAVTGLFTPISAKDIVEEAKANGVPEATAIAILNLLGMGARTPEEARLNREQARP